MTKSGDPMQATPSGKPLVCGPLAAVTVASGDPARMRRMMQGAFALTPSFERFEGARAGRLADHWGIEPRASIEVTVFKRPEVDDAVTLRVLRVSPSAPIARPNLDCRYLGALGFGLAVSGLRERHAIVEQYGFTARAGVTVMAFPRADGTTYDVGETHWVAPDEFLVLGVDRSDMTPIGSIDSVLGMGGPNYSSALVGDVARTGAFLDQILGLELRREFTFESEGPQGGMGLPKGTRVHFQQWFAPDTRSGYLVIMQLLDNALPAPQALGLRSRGIGMWSFRAADVDLVFQRARLAGVSVLREPGGLTLPGAGEVSAMVIATPDGFPIEIYS